MNYTVCVLALILLVSLATYLIQGRKHFTGPRDIEGLLKMARHGLQKGETVPVIGMHME